MVGLRRGQLLILVVAWAACVLAPLGSTVLSEHEVFAAEPGREMLAGRGLVLQPFAGQYRTKKPPGQSWLIAASVGLTGSHREWAARLPSALAGLGLALVMASTATWLATPRRGLIAGLMVLTCIGVQQRARLAEADMGLAFCVALANAAVIWGLLARRPPADTRAARACVYWAAVVAGCLLKGPIVFGFTLLPALVAWGVLRFTSKNRPAATAVVRVAFWWPAVAVGTLALVAWLAVALHTYPGAYAQWRHELVDRFNGDVGHGDEHRRDPLLSYLWMLPFATAPWVVFVLPALRAWWRARVTRPADVLLICWAACGFVLLSLIAFKVLHYALPILPPVLLRAAAGFDRSLTLWLRRRPRERRALWERAALAGWFGVAVVGWGVFDGLLLPRHDQSIEVRRFADRVNAVVPPGQTLYLFRVGEDRTAWYLDAPLRQTEDLPPRPAYLVCNAADLVDLRRLANTTVLVEAKPYAARGSAGQSRVLARVD